MSFFLRARLWVLAWVLCSWPATAGEPQRPLQPGKLTVTFFDVGQGDAALIVSPEGKTVLVDGGPPEAASQLANRVRALVAGPLDLVVMSHPHLDHLGGIQEVIQKVGAKRFLDPGFSHPSAAYSSLLQALSAAGVELRGVETDQATPLRVGLGKDAFFEVLWPRTKQRGFLTGTRSDANANSVVLRVRYGSTRILFTGDSEAPTEEGLLEDRFDISADVLKVAHHGSRHSSLPEFLKAVHPRVAVISCGRNNEFRHPSPPTLGRLTHEGAEIFRTDEDGEVQLVSDGTRIQMTSSLRPPHTFSFRGGGERPEPDATAKKILPSLSGKDASLVKEPGMSPSPHVAVAPTEAPGESVFVSKRGSPVFHKASCHVAQKFSGEDRLLFGSRDEAAAQLRPAKDCDP